MKQTLQIYLGSFVATIVLFRFILFFSPNINLNVGQYNIHHLYTGAFILVILTILLLFNIKHWVVTALVGISSAMIIDELVYLIATDGSDAAYLSGTSNSGAMILGGMIVLITGGIYIWNGKKTPR